MIFRFINGRRVDDGAGAVECSDAAFMLGEAAFETMLACDGLVLRLDDHRKRLARGLRHLGICPFDWAGALSCLDEFRRSSSTSEAILRVQVSRGPLEGGFGSNARGASTAFVSVSDAPSRPASLRAVLIDWPRRAQGGLASDFKCLGYANELAARRKAVEGGAEVALMLGSSGHVCCADTANFFVVSGDKILTPPISSGALPGTVRAQIAKLASEEGYALVEEGIGPEQLVDTDGLFLTNAFLGACLIDHSVDRRLPSASQGVRELVNGLREKLLDVDRYGHAVT